MKLDPSRTAVLALHWMEDVVRLDGAMGALYGQAVADNQMIPNAVRLVDLARSAGVALAYTVLSFRPGHADLVESGPIYSAVKASGGLIGMGPSDIITELAPHDDDIIVTHNRVSGFSDSSLDLLLRTRGVDTLLVTGVATNVTVDSTARAASDLGYHVVIVEDCTTTDDPATQKAFIDTFRLIAEVATVDEVQSALSAA